ncbi:MAG: LLM class flavin-dependent oxidoreductase [Asticcacaulis sp.]|uniref:LLM class flavin-dependent oxidoreductase n=1 Tax=Asticcacaulis sp. TaxID=1872648 RepID=UPI0039E32FAF
MTQSTNRQIKLGAILEGVGMTPAVWRHPDVPSDASININWYIDNARLAEAAKFDFVFIVDSPYITPDSAPHFLNRLEPLTLLSALAVSTQKIGLVATLTTSYWEPYNVARQFGSLDLISGGRAGWNVVTTGLEGAARNYGRDAHYDHAVRYARAGKFVGVVQGLWDSYEDDAFPRNKDTGVFLDKTKQHALNHKGEFFSVAGPLALTRSPQGQPVIFQAGDSHAGRDLGALIADATFTTGETIEDAKAYYADLKARAVALGRNPDEIIVTPGIDPIIADTDEAAQAIAESRRKGLDLDKALVQVGRAFNYHDFRQYPLDAPFPDTSGLTLNSYKGHAERIIRIAREDNLTLRQVAQRFGVWQTGFVGSPETVADQLEHWFTERAADGFILRVTIPDSFAAFREKVVPILQARGLFRKDYTETTLRGHLGLSIPENRYTQQRHGTSGETLTPVVREVEASLT